MKKYIVTGLIVALASVAVAAGPFQITRSAVQNPNSLAELLNKMDTEQDETRALVNELRTWATTLATALNVDSGVNDTTYDAVISSSAVTEQVSKGK